MRRWQGWAGRRRRSCQPDVYLLPRTEDTRLCRATWVCVLIVRVYLLCVSTLCIYTVYLLYVSKSISGHCIVSAPRAGPHSTWSKLVLSASGSRRCRRRRRRWRAGVRCGELATGPAQWREERRRIHHPVADLDTATHHSSLIVISSPCSPCRGFVELGMFSPKAQWGVLGRLNMCKCEPVEQTCKL